MKRFILLIGIAWVSLGMEARAYSNLPDDTTPLIDLECLNQDNSPGNSVQSFQCQTTWKQQLQPIGAFNFTTDWGY